MVPKPQGEVEPAHVDEVAFPSAITPEPSDPGVHLPPQALALLVLLAGVVMAHIGVPNELRGEQARLGILLPGSGGRWDGGAACEVARC